MAENPKALYLEADEDITSAIDKLNRAPGERVSIVVPKHSTLLQSIINLRLLKKAAGDAGKDLVLVTTDRTATNLAGRVGLATASSLTAKPVLAESKAKEPDSGAEIDEDEIDTAPPAAAAALTGLGSASSELRSSSDERQVTGDAADEVGAATPPTTSSPKLGSGFSHRAVGDAAAEAAVSGQPKAADGASAKAQPATRNSNLEPGTHGLRVPDFNSLQKRVLWAGGLLGVVLVLFLLQFFLTKATVTLYAQGSKVNVNFPLHIDPQASSSDLGNSTLAGQKLTSNKTLTASAQATGTKDIGAKATGTVTVTNRCYNPGILPAGTVFTAADPGGHKFLSTQSVAVPIAVFAGGTCNATTASVPVQAAANGDEYNLAPTSYAVGSFPSSGLVYLSGQGGQMSGGVAKTVPILTQADVDKARDAALAADKAGAQKDLESKVNSGYQAVSDTLSQNASAVSASPAVGEQTSQSSVTVTVDYTELAVNSNDFKTLLNQQEQKQVGANNQLYDDGLNTAKLAGQPGSGDVTVTTTAFAGQKIDKTAVAKQLAGRRYGDATDLASKLPGVQRADISIWPGFESNLPHLSGHITVIIKVATGG